MADLINNDVINTAVEGAKDFVEETAPEIKKGVSKKVVAVVSAVGGFVAGVGAKIGFDAIKEKRAAAPKKIEQKNEEIDDGDFIEVNLDESNEEVSD